MKSICGKPLPRYSFRHRLELDYLTTFTTQVASPAPKTGEQPRFAFCALRVS